MLQRISPNQKLIKMRRVLLISFSALVLVHFSALAEYRQPQNNQVPDSDDSEKLVIWGESNEKKPTDSASPRSLVTLEDMLSINATTSEDLLKHEPSLVIRKRYIGDSTGIIGIRGSNMFQTTHSMVFADGVPLHYLLQTRWSGAPRWSLVSVDEIAQVEVLYGPYSAEYSGNAMGGVINIETSIPTERRVHLQSSFFTHDYSELGFNQQLNGNRHFLSFEDKVEDFSFYFSYNRLKNKGHPQIFRFDRNPSNDSVDNSVVVTGGLFAVDEYGNNVVYYGDNGVAKEETNNFKIKLGYELENWFVLFNMAYEDRATDTRFANSYLRDNNGEVIWSGDVVQDGQYFSVSERNFAGSELNRNSLLTGFRVQGELTKDWQLESHVSSFSILKDESFSSIANINSPAYTSAGAIRVYDDTGWQTAKVSLQHDQFMQNDNLSFVVGAEYERYQLEINNYNSEDYLADIRTELTGASGGKTKLESVYAQINWDLNSRWNSVIGGRYESWSSEDGFFDDELHADRDESRFSPKLSVTYQMNDSWMFRYSAARAFRFAIVEELFLNERRTQGSSLANASLEPENGFYQNLMLQKNIEHGFLRVNYFTEAIDDVIFAQTTVVDNRAINTFIPIDRVDTDGVEFIYNQVGMLNNKLDVRFNATYLDSKIDKNSANRAIEGNDFPRTSDWRANLTANYHVNDDWDIGGGIRFTTSNFGDLSNADTIANVFGAQDGYLFMDLKSNYQINQTTKISLGVDNINNEVAFVHHPWPLRTFYINISFDFE
jgi:iron complex outermembrane recepter protein